MLFQNLSKKLKEMRDKSRCPVCGKPALDIQQAAPTSFRRIRGRNVDVESLPALKSRAARGLCCCHRLYISHFGEELKTHPLFNSVLRAIEDVETEDGNILAVTVIPNSGGEPVRITAESFPYSVDMKLIDPELYFSSLRKEGFISWRWPILEEAA